tara:strand:+ start:157 stop:993 length:837 start_codon:yes stop_codon:yes gene_type:complete
MTTGYNYLIRDTISKPAIYKIGVSGVLDKRLKQLKDGILTSVVGIWSSPHYEDLERQLHKLFPMKRLPQSEWFKLSEDEVIKVIAETSQQAHLEFLIPEFKPAEPVAAETSSALALREPAALARPNRVSRPDVRTYRVPASSRYSASSGGTWTDYSAGSTTDLTVPLRKKSRVEQLIAIHDERKRTDPDYAASCVKTEPPVFVEFFAGMFIGWIPFINLFYLFAGALSKEARNSTGYAGACLGTFLCVLAIALGTASEAKPLHTYEQQSHINVIPCIY